MLLLIGSNSIWGQSKEKYNPSFYPTLSWAATQLVPSPQWNSKINGGSDFAFRWQVTPLLFSWGVNQNVSGWRYLVADPFARQVGSVELFASPEYVFSDGKFSESWMFRGGVRSYFPVWNYGQYMSLSAAISYYNYNGDNGISYEAGAYLYAGILGFQTTYSPNSNYAKWIFTIRLRYF